MIYKNQRSYLYIFLRCNVIRSELMTVLNNALGGPFVQEIYITELAIQ